MAETWSLTTQRDSSILEPVLMVRSTRTESCTGMGERITNGRAKTHDCMVETLRVHLLAWALVFSLTPEWGCEAHPAAAEKRKRKRTGRHVIPASGSKNALAPIVTQAGPPVAWRNSIRLRGVRINSLQADSLNLGKRPQHVDGDIMAAVDLLDMTDTLDMEGWILECSRWMRMRKKILRCEGGARMGADGAILRACRCGKEEVNGIRILLLSAPMS